MSYVIFDNNIISIFLTIPNFSKIIKNHKKYRKFQKFKNRNRTKSAQILVVIIFNNLNIILLSSI